MANTTETSSTLLHKIIIPVITTVLGATAIYFLGFNRKTSDPEKATVNAWQTFVTSQNIVYKNVNSVNEEYTDKLTTEVKEGGIKGIAPTLREYKDEIFKIADKGREDVETLIRKDDVDEAFVSMMKRYLANSKDEKQKMDDFFDELISLTKSNLTEEEKGTRFAQEAEKLTKMAKRTEEREANEAEEIAQTLSKKYNRPFDLNELKVYVDYKKDKDKKEPEKNPDETPTKVDVTGPAPVDPNRGTEYKENPQKDETPYDYNNTNNQSEPTEALLTGNWSMTGGELELSKNGSMYWVFDGKGYTSGDWKLTDGKINMNATNPDTKKTSLIIGYVSNFNRNSFTMTFMTSPREIYNFKRKNY